jgi:hypothetical protein
MIHFAIIPQDDGGVVGVVVTVFDDTEDHHPDTFEVENEPVGSMDVAALSCNSATIPERM